MDIESANASDAPGTFSYSELQKKRKKAWDEELDAGNDPVDIRRHEQKRAEQIKQRQVDTLYDPVLIADVLFPKRPSVQRMPYEEFYRIVGNAEPQPHNEELIRAYLKKHGKRGEERMERSEQFQATMYRPTLEQATYLQSTDWSNVSLSDEERKTLFERDLMGYGDPLYRLRLFSEIDRTPERLRNDVEVISRPCFVWNSPPSTGKPLIEQELGRRWSSFFYGSRRYEIQRLIYNYSIGNLRDRPKPGSNLAKQTWDRVEQICSKKIVIVDPVKGQKIIRRICVQPAHLYKVTVRGLTHDQQRRPEPTFSESTKDGPLLDDLFDPPAVVSVQQYHRQMDHMSDTSSDITSLSSSRTESFFAD